MSKKHKKMWNDLRYLMFESKVNKDMVNHSDIAINILPLINQLENKSTLMTNKKIHYKNHIPNKLYSPITKPYLFRDINRDSKLSSKKNSDDFAYKYFLTRGRKVRNSKKNYKYMWKSLKIELFFLKGEYLKKGKAKDLANINYVLKTMNRMEKRNVLKKDRF